MSLPFVPAHSGGMWESDHTKIHQLINDINHSLANMGEPVTSAVTKKKKKKSRASTNEDLYLQNLKRDISKLAETIDEVRARPELDPDPPSTRPERLLIVIYSMLRHINLHIQSATTPDEQMDRIRDGIKEVTKLLNPETLTNPNNKPPHEIKEWQPSNSLKDEHMARAKLDTAWMNDSPTPEEAAQREQARNASANAQDCTEDEMMGMKMESMEFPKASYPSHSPEEKHQRYERLYGAAWTERDALRTNVGSKNKDGQKS